MRNVLYSNSLETGAFFTVWRGTPYRLKHDSFPGALNALLTEIYACKIIRSGPHIPPAGDAEKMFERP